MFELPSMWSIMISTIVFFIAVWYIKRLLDEQGIPKGMTRSLGILCWLICCRGELERLQTGFKNNRLHSVVIGLKDIMSYENNTKLISIFGMIKILQANNQHG